MSKPLILCTLSEDSSVPSSLATLIAKHFTIVNEPEFTANPSIYSDDIVAIINMHCKPKITEALLKKLPSLKIVAVCGVGYNHVDVKMVRSFGAKVSNSPGVLDETVADMGMLLLMAAGRGIVNAIQVSKSPEKMLASKNMMTMDVHSSTLGIVGMGRIGYAVARRAKAFNMKILYHNRNKRPASDEEAVDATYHSDINDMLPLCDYVMVAVCLTPETKGMFGATQFKKMKTSSVFINISRGDVVDQDALVDSLTNGEIQSAALDVTTPEPLPKDHPLLKMRNVIVTPHIGSASLNTRINMMQKSIDNVLAVLHGKPMPSEVTS